MSYRCDVCGYRSTKWMGFCPQCRTDGALAQEFEGSRQASHSAEVVSITKVRGNHVPRLPTGIGEVDRVLGGGLVPGAAILVGGEPGVGKSTLLLQVAGSPMVH